MGPLRDVHRRIYLAVRGQYNKSRGANGKSTNNRIITEPWSVHKGILVRQFFEDILLPCSSWRIYQENRVI